jgi:hypothetical protein
VSLGYRDVQDPSVYIKAKVIGEENTYFLVWTTTPWTLISNVALAVNPDVEYVKVRYKDDLLILAKERLSVMPEGTEIVEIIRGHVTSDQTYQATAQLAKDLGIETSTLFKKMRSLGIQKPRAAAAGPLRKRPTYAAPSPLAWATPTWTRAPCIAPSP